MPKPAIAPGADLGQKIIDHIGYSNAALEKAAAAQEKQAAAQREIESLIPACVDALVANQRIDSTEKQAAAELLKDPVKAIQLLTKVAAHKNAAEISRLGSSTGGQTKTASHNSLSSPYVGARSSGMKESDRRLFAGLGMAVPE